MLNFIMMCIIKNDFLQLWTTKNAPKKIWMQIEENVAMKTVLIKMKMWV